jgi:hypothetical protein
MRRNPRLFRLTATVALTALLCDSLLPLAAVAQPAPPPLPEAGQGRPSLVQGDPPARVGRIAGMTGAVSFHNEGDTSWSRASLNYPVSSGNAFWTEPSASARLEISDSRIVLGSGSEFDVTTLDASGLQAVAAQGEAYIHLRDLAPDEAWSIQTPRGLVRLSGQGRYEIVVGTTDQPTLVTVVDGAAQIDGPGVSLLVAGGQTATITGTDSFQGSVGPALRDAFLTAMLDVERPRPAAGVAVPEQVYAMAGGSDLADIGSWSQAPVYGPVWYPPVSRGWVPYRVGHWAYVSPWGWTWIDDASWGFAPFHYGRWVEIGGRWAWTPGEARHQRPVYAPALVSFIGIGAGVAIGATLVSRSIGWVPLGPREEYHPWYHASKTYVREVNVAHVTNIVTNTNVIHNNVTTINYINRAAATSVPAAAMAASRPVQAVARPVTAQELAAARPIRGQQPIRPTAATAGVTPVVARQLKLAPAPVMAKPAPGPVVRPVPAGATGFVRPAFAPTGKIPAPGGVGPGGSAAPVSGAKPAGVPIPQASPSAVAPMGPRPGLPKSVAPEAGKTGGVPPIPQAGAPAADAPLGPRPGLPKSVTPEAGKTGGVPPIPQAGAPAAVAPLGPRPGPPRSVTPEAAKPSFIPMPHTAPPAAAPPATGRPALPNVAGPQAVRPAGVPSPQTGHPAAVMPAAPRAAPSNVVRPEVIRPTGVPPPQLAWPAAVPQMAPRPMQPNAAPHTVPVVPHPAPQPVAPPVRQPASMPRPQPAAPPPRAFVPTAARPEPPHAAPPVPHPAAPVQPQEHKKAPGQP